MRPRLSGFKRNVNNNNDNNNNNNNNNNESLFHQNIKLHILCYNNTEDKKTMTKKYLHTYIFKKYVITINGA